MTWLADEQSAEEGAPREGFEIRLPSVVYRVCSGDRDVTIGGNVFRASPAARGELGVSVIGGVRELEFSLPITHAVPQRYLLGGIPPQTIRIICHRRQERSGESERVWAGRVQSMRVDKHAAIFVITSRLGDTLDRKIPVLTLGRQCPHVLYDINCGVKEKDFRVSTSVVSSDGTTIVVASMGGHPDQWARWGRLVDINTGEGADVVSQVGTTLEIDLPLVETQDGALVFVSAGCAHDMLDCRVKFGNNQTNYGGGPSTPDSNPMIPGKGLGIIQQT